MLIFVVRRSPFVDFECTNCESKRSKPVASFQRQRARWRKCLDSEILAESYNPTSKRSAFVKTAVDIVFKIVKTINSENIGSPNQPRIPIPSMNKTS